MYTTIERIYKRTENKTLVKNAVKKGWITELQYKTLTGEGYSICL